MKRRLLAGGYSLVPMINLRLARPEHLIDINELGLDKIENVKGAIRIGALVRHHQLLHDPIIADRLPLYREAASHIAHPTIRNRGSFGGSLAHADPTAELVLLAVLHDGVVVVEARDGERRVAASDFFKGAFTTALGAAEMIVAFEVPSAIENFAGAFFEISERHGDFAIVAVGALVRAEKGKISEARIVCAGASSVPIRSREIEDRLVGMSLDKPDAQMIGSALAAAIEPPSDIRATSAYRRHLVSVLTERAVATACLRAGEMK